MTMKLKWFNYPRVGGPPSQGALLDDDYRLDITDVYGSWRLTNRHRPA